MQRAWILVVLALCGCWGHASSDAPQPIAPVAEPVPLPTRFDGFDLGDRFGSKVMRRDPYRAPCDDDPIESGQARAMVYAARECRGHTFPEETTVVFILANHGNAGFDDPIRAFGWMGGYYDDRIKLAVHRGDPAGAAATAWGKPLASFDLRRLHVDQYPGVSVLVDKATIVGFAFGDLPANPELERWNVFDDMYRRYTPMMPDPHVSNADCLALLRHIAQLNGLDPDAAILELRGNGRYDGKMERCRTEATPAKIQCVLAAASLGDLKQCD